jgi:hypothetical protein
LNISWNPSDRVAAARKARRFVLEAVLVRVAEAQHEFVQATVQLPKFEAVRKSWSDRTSLAEKLSALVNETIGADNYLAAGAALLIHWRNRVVHPKSRAELTPLQTKVFLGAATEIETKFAGLSVEKLLEDFDKDRATLKDISSLIAMSIRANRAIDAEVNALSSEDLEALLDYYDLRTRIAVIKAETTPSKRCASVLRLLQSTAPGLVQSYSRLYTDEG